MPTLIYHRPHADGFRLVVHLDESKLVAESDPRLGVPDDERSENHLGQPLQAGNPDPAWCFEHIVGADAPQTGEGIYLHGGVSDATLASLAKQHNVTLPSPASRAEKIVALVQRVPGARSTPELRAVTAEQAEQSRALEALRLAREELARRIPAPLAESDPLSTEGMKLGE